MHVINWRQYARPNIVGALLFATSHPQPLGQKNIALTRVIFDVRHVGNVMTACRAA